MGQRSDDDISLFPVLASARARQVLEELLERDMPQVELGKVLEVQKQALGPVVNRLERAGLVARDAPRGLLTLTRYDQIADLLELEASIVDDIHADKALRADERRRRMRKRRMSGGVRRGARDSA